MKGKTSQKDYLNKCSVVHNNFYLYDKVVFDKKRDYIEVGCPVHGYYKVRADHHERGIKCRNCNQGNPLGVFNKGNAENHKEHWLQIDAWLYFLEIRFEKETFFKVGVVTNENIDNRLKEFPKNYSIKVIYFEKGNLYNHTFSESKILEDFRSLKYHPNEEFRGKNECFKENPLEYYYNYKLDINESNN